MAVYGPRCSHLFGISLWGFINSQFQDTLHKVALMPMFPELQATHCQSFCQQLHHEGHILVVLLYQGWVFFSSIQVSWMLPIQLLASAKCVLLMHCDRSAAQGAW